MQKDQKINEVHPEACQSCNLSGGVWLQREKVQISTKFTWDLNDVGCRFCLLSFTNVEFRENHDRGY